MSWKNNFITPTHQFPQNDLPNNHKGKFACNLILININFVAWVQSLYDLFTLHIKISPLRSVTMTNYQIIFKMLLLPMAFFRNISFNSRKQWVLLQRFCITRVSDQRSVEFVKTLTNYLHSNTVAFVEWSWCKWMTFFTVDGHTNARQTSELPRYGRILVNVIT